MKKKLFVSIVLSMVMLFAFSAVAMAAEDTEANENSATVLEDTPPEVEWCLFGEPDAIKQIESEENVVSYDPETKVITIVDKEGNRVGVSRGAGILTITASNWSENYINIDVQASATFNLSEMGGEIDVWDANLLNLPIKSS